MKLADIVRRHSLGGILLTDLTSIRHASGFTGTAATIIATPRRAFFITDFRYLEQARRQIGTHFVISDMAQGWPAILKKIFPPSNRNPTCRIGFEADTIPYAYYHKFKRLLSPLTMVPIAEASAVWRMQKASPEIASLRQAYIINQRAFAAFGDFIVPGQSETRLRQTLEIELIRQGAERISFDTIIASGRRGALPHGVATNKKIKNGEFITIDFGAVYNGYHADETCTVALGKITARQQRVFQAVYDAVQIALSTIRPGVLACAIDAAARDHIAKQGFGHYFGHALGHGVGLQVHERPVLSPHSKDVILENMVFTIEPGIYIPGWGGVRIEETVRVTPGGAEKLSRLPKELRLFC